MIVAGGRMARDTVPEAGTRLAAAGCETPRLDAELLLAEALGVDRAALLGRELELDAEAAERFERLIVRREAREPVAYILGRRPFRHIELAVDRRVLIPRPETELLVEVALGLPRGARVVDVAAGSGAVALALKHERADLQVTGTDISEDALAVARANAERLGLDVDFRCADLLDGPADAVVANLPYVREDEWPALAPEIRDHEPPQALLGGSDGLDVIRRLARADVPWIALEVGAGQASPVSGLLRDSGCGRVETHRDLAGAERVVVGRR